MKKYRLKINSKRSGMSDFELAIPAAAESVFPMIEWNFC